jgi:site-specific recombinase XerD
MQTDLRVLVENFLESLEVERNVSKLTVRNYRHYLMVLADFLEGRLVRSPLISDIDGDNIRSWRVYLSRQPGTAAEEMKSVTQGYYVIALRSFLKWCIKNDIACYEPEKIDVPKVKEHSLKFLNEEQIGRLLNQPLASTTAGVRDKAILELLFSTGLRVSELVSLNSSVIDFKTREFSVKGKGGKVRVVFISKEAAEFLEKYMRQRTDHFKPLFVRLGGRMMITDDDEKMRLTPRSVQRLVKHYVQLAKLPVDATPHTLRHSMATDLLRAGADLRSVQEILGHKNIATTQIYTHVTDARLKEVHEKFHQGNKDR